MCGIGFFAKYKTKKFDLDVIKNTFISLESRGTDASGIYYERIEKVKGKDVVAVRAIKAPFKSSEIWPVIQKSKHALNGNEYFIMMHSRAKTRGTEYKNVNNHPVFSENYALIHNGMIASDPLDFYSYEGEVDSEIAVSYIETFGVEEGLSLLHGTMAFVFKKKRAKEFFLFRQTNPLVVAYSQKDGILCGTSTEAQLPYQDNGSFQERIISPPANMSQTEKGKLYKVSLLTSKPEIAEVAKIDEAFRYQAEEKLKKSIQGYKSRRLKAGKGGKE